MTTATIIAGRLAATPAGLALYSGRRLVAVLHPDTSAGVIAQTIAAHFGTSARLVSGARGIEVHVPMTVSAAEVQA